MTTVAIPFVHVKASQNPNLKVSEGETGFEPYMRAMTVAFASVRRWNSHFDLEFISNKPPEGQNIENFNELDVTYREVPFDHCPPNGFVERFAASFYLLDALRAANAQTTLFIDPDVLCIRPLQPLISSHNGYVGALHLNYPVDAKINGLSRVEAAALHLQLGEPISASRHFGGEAYLVPGDLAQLLFTRSEKAWEFSLERHKKGLTKFTTEEHIMSFALRGVPQLDIDAHIRRIWTAHRFRTVDGRESDLSLWHLPAEKDRGFRLLYQLCLDRRSWFWQAERDEFVYRCGVAMGLHNRKPYRYAKDVAGELISVSRNLKTKWVKSTVQKT